MTLEAVAGKRWPRVARISAERLDGLGEVAGHLGESGDEEVAEVVAFKVALVEAVAEKAGDEALVFGEGDHAVAEVAGGQHVEVAAQASAGAAIVGDGDDGGQVGDEGLGGRLSEQTGVWHTQLEATQEGGEAGSSTNGDDAQARGGS